MTSAFERRLSKLEQAGRPSGFPPGEVLIIGVGENETEQAAIARQYPDGPPPHGMMIFLIPVIPDMGRFDHAGY